MRKTYLYSSLLILVAIVFVTCKKETDDKIDVNEKFYYENPQSIAQVKFVHAYTPLTINGIAAATTAGTTTSGTGFRLTMDGNKLNGPFNTGSTASYTNTLMWGNHTSPVPANDLTRLFPPTNSYAFLPPGSHNFKFTMNRITANNYAPIAGDEVFSSTVALEAGKKYSMFIADPFGPPSTFMVEDVFSVPNMGQFGIRFINLSAEPTLRYDVTSARHGIKLFSNVGYKEMKDYIYLPTTSTDTIYLKNAATNAVIAQLNGFFPSTQRVYTFYARGKTGVANRGPGLVYYVNR